MNGLKWFLGLTLVASLTTAGHAAHLFRGDGCPSCGHKKCQPEPVTLKVKKHCYYYTDKPICIPSVKGPFQPCCEPPKCGWVRKVRLLKKDEYECEKCGYKWEVPCVCGSDCEKQPCQ